VLNAEQISAMLTAASPRDAALVVLMVVVAGAVLRRLLVAAAVMVRIVVAVVLVVTMVAVAVQPDCASPTAEAPSLTTLAVVPAPVPVPWEFLWEQEQTVLQVCVTEYPSRV
jgi:hypothetical protein